MPGVNIQFATLQNVYGRIARSRGFAFSAADLQLNGSSFSMTMPLNEFVLADAPPVLSVPLRDQFDAAWVVARIPQVFGVQITPSEAEKTLLGQGFVAIPEGEQFGYAFECTDHYGRTGLMFSDEGPEKSIRSSIAEAFWSLLLESPDELQDFEHRVYHPGAGVWLTFGCNNGDLYCTKSDD